MCKQLGLNVKLRWGLAVQRWFYITVLYTCISSIKQMIQLISLQKIVYVIADLKYALRRQRQACLFDIKSFQSNVFPVREIRAAQTFHHRAVIQVGRYLVVTDATSSGSPTAVILIPANSLMHYHIPCNVQLQETVGSW